MSFSNKQKVFFLDRDGVVNIEKNYLYKIEDFEFIDGVFETLRYLKKLDYKFIIVTNQSGISRGYYSKDDFDRLTSWMLKKFEEHNIKIEAVLLCPHGPDDNCNCRKPKIGMIEQAKELFDIDLKNSWMVGDKGSDIQLAVNSKIGNTIQVMTGHIFDKENSKADYVLESIKSIPDIVLK
ncbi:MAG: D-glycero-beta-D-manno-heptose 1,7-bisphosphate 7-phosphatase [Campylobacterota bacterium]|nr:D-glycero-beta-D-manno-heptose 1,7-bisphosphate 7-phosphatase [Campylobacterota bacterium]